VLPDLGVIQGPYLQDILDQPQALRNTLRGLEEPRELRRMARLLEGRKPGRIVLTGMGGSFHALHPLRLKLIDHGFTAIAAETSELIHYESRWLDSQSLLIVASQSGRSAEVKRLLEMNRGRAPVIAVTNTPESPLAQRADVAILTSAGAEFSVSCKTYVTTLTALKWTGDILCGHDVRRTRRELSTTAAAAAGYLADWEKHVHSLADWLHPMERLFLVGRGPSLAAVGAGALITKESVRVHAEGMGSAAFRHGPFEMLRRGIFVLVFSGEPKTRALHRKLLRDVRQLGASAEAVGEEAAVPALELPTVPRDGRPVLEILPAQMVTLALALKSGHEPGRFAVVSKVTSTE